MVFCFKTFHSMPQTSGHTFLKFTADAKCLDAGVYQADSACLRQFLSIVDLCLFFFLIITDDEFSLSAGEGFQTFVKTIEFGFGIVHLCFLLCGMRR